MGQVKRETASNIQADKLSPDQRLSGKDPGRETTTMSDTELKEGDWGCCGLSGQIRERLKGRASSFNEEMESVMPRSEGRAFQETDKLLERP